MLRITPAGAGKTSDAPSNEAPVRDHPRRCGENADKMAAEEFEAGSPPQVRGKLRARCRLHDINRITPAGAGKTLKQKRQYAVNEDHPRRCGENISDPACCSSIKGSPPQVRGKPERNISGRSGFGITPAGAGKTLSLFFPPQLRQDHPRRCGENETHGLPTRVHRGSPPQVRGKLHDVESANYDERITPAGAGKTFPR